MRTLGAILRRDADHSQVRQCLGLRVELPGRAANPPASEEEDGGGALVVGLPAIGQENSSERGFPPGCLNSMTRSGVRLFSGTAAVSVMQETSRQVKIRVAVRNMGAYTSKPRGSIRSTQKAIDVRRSYLIDSPFPVIGAEGDGGEVFPVEKVACRVRIPAVAHGGGLGDGGRGHDHGVALDHGVSPDEFPVFSGDREAGGRFYLWR